MVYTDGSLITDTREVAVSETWETQSDWDAAAQKDNVEVVDGSVQLIEGINTVVDDFEDGDLSEYDGDLSDYSVQQSTVFEGSDALEQSISNGVSLIASSSGLDNYVEVGDLWEFRHYWDQDPTGMQSYFAFGMSGGESGWEPDQAFYLALNPRADQINIFRFVSGSIDTLASETVTSWPVSEWTRVEGSWSSDGTISMTYEAADGTEIASISTTNTSYQSNTQVGFQKNSDGATGTAFFDEVMVAKGGAD